MNSICNNEVNQDFVDLLSSLAKSWELFQDLLSAMPWKKVCQKYGNGSDKTLTLYGFSYAERDRNNLVKRLSQIVEVAR